MKRILLYCCLAALIVVAASCKERENVAIEDTTALYYEYVSGVTSGLVKRNDPIVVRFTHDIVTPEEVGSSVSSKVIELSPSVAGKTAWASTDAIVFTPDKAFDWDKEYAVKVNLKKIIDDLPKELGVMTFNIITMPQNVHIESHGLSIADNKIDYYISGNINTSDAFDPDEVEKQFSASQNGQTLEVEWYHKPGMCEHQFTIKGIKQKDARSEVQIGWQSDKKLTKKISIPAVNEFVVSSIDVVSDGSQYIEITFSNIVDASLDYRGAFVIENCKDLKIAINDNTVKLYPTERLEGSSTLELSSAIKSTNGYSLSGDLEYAIAFGSEKPSVKLVGKGVMIPQGQGFVVPFEAVGLNAVDVRITKIFANNVNYFLQERSFDGQWGLNNVGRTIKRMKVDLTNRGASNLNMWNAFSLDLSNFITVEPGAIYNVEIGFRKSYSLYPCEENSDDEIVDEHYVPIEDEDDNPELSYENIYYQYYSSWEESNNPCNQSYFSPYRSVSRNVMLATYGIIAKCDRNKNTFLYVTNLINAKPESGVKITLFDYQNQELSSGVTNADGMLKVQTPRDVFMVVAKKNSNIGYLKIDVETSENISNFDVSGTNVEKGIKGFIYAERSVWRPGDSIFTSFILDDHQSPLPSEHPIVMEVRNSRNQLVKKMVRKHDNKFIYPFFFNTDANDPTGNWNLTVSIGSIKFSKQIRIETVKPNRLKISLDFDREILSVNQSNRGKLSAKWLHGADAGDMKARIDVSYTQVKPYFEKWKNYDFSTPNVHFSESDNTVFDGKLNSEGNADIQLGIAKNSNAVGFMKANFITKVFEPGGDFSINSISKLVSLHRDYVGLNIDWSYPNWNKLNCDESHTIKIASVDENGKQVSLNNIKIQLFELDYKWWYNSNYEDFASYVGSTYHRPVITKTIKTVDGKGEFKLDADENRIGRHLLLVTSPNGHTCGQVIYFGWSWGREKNSSDAKILAVISDKEKYEVGEDITISFPANKEASALVTFETGNSIIGQQWLTNLDNYTKFTFKAKPEMAPNIYVHVSLIQPHGQTANDLPIRMFGIVPVLVESKATHLQPEIEQPEEVRPQKEFTVKVSEANKQAMEYTLAIVDEGLLDLTNFRTPNPWGHFYAREALGVTSYDMYDYVMGAFGGRFESMFAIGGSDAVTDPSKQKAERFKAVVKVLGPYKLDKGKTASHKITLPQYVGSVRTMVVAAENGKYGCAEKTMSVREPLMVLATLPRVLSIGETVDLPISVFAMNNSVKNVKIKVSVSGMASVDGTSEGNISFNKIGEKDIMFSLKAGDKPGIAKLKVEASSGKETAVHEIEIDVRIPNTPHAEYDFKVLSSGEILEKSLKAIGIDGTNEAQIEISSLPSLNLGRRLDYLIRYPHGCVEQVTSAAFPQIYLPKLIDVDKDKQNQITANITTAMSKLIRHQTSDGGFAYWPGCKYSDEWGSCYAGHFFVEAEKAGYSIPSNVKSSWLKYMRNEVSDFKIGNRHYNQFTQIYRLYLLALAGEPQVAAMNRIKSISGLDNQSRWMLAGAYALSGMKETAVNLIDFRNMQPDASESEYYGSVLRDKAFMLQTTLLLNNQEQAAKLALEISKELSGSGWLSTQTTAMALISMAQFIEANGGNKKAAYNLTINGKKTNSNRNGSIHSFSTEINLSKPTDVNIENTGKSNLYVTITNRGIKSGIDTESLSRGIDMSVGYKLSPNYKITINPETIAQGTDFVAVVTVTNRNASAINNMALTQVFPAGWEIVNTQLFGNETQNNVSAFDYRDIRDDRVLTYFSLEGYATKTFMISLNATYTGKYVLPPVTCEAMYDNSFYAKVGGMDISVVKQ